jgi:hypothetical protein
VYQFRLIIDWHGTCISLREGRNIHLKPKLFMTKKEGSFVDLLSGGIWATSQERLRRFFKRHFRMKGLQSMRQKYHPEKKAMHDPSRSIQPPQRRVDQHRAAPRNIIQQCGQIGLLQAKRQILRDFFDYRSAKAQFTGAMEEPHVLFKRFLAATADRKCLRLSFDADAEPEFGPNWVTVELSTVDCRAKKAGSVSIDHEDGYFESVLCTNLDRMSRPESLITEVKRILRPAGQIWVEASLNAPYFDAMNLAQTEYWRITPHGLRILLENFDEILCSIYLPGGSALRTCSFFYGLKRWDEPGENRLIPVHTSR